MNKRSGNSSQPQEGIFRGVLLAYFVVVLHVVLIMGLGVVMFLFGGVVAYLPWILVLASVVVAGSCYLWWKHLKKRGKSLRDMIRDPLYQGRTVEVSFLGGVVNVKLGQSQGPLTIEHTIQETPRQIVDPATQQAEELTRLAHLLKDDVITIDEYLEAKKEITGK